MSSQQNPNHSRSRGRPTRSVLTQQRITEAACALISRDGFRHFTMRNLARHLGVSPSALYNHSKSREEILVWVQESVSERLDLSGFGSSPLRVALTQWARSYLAVLREDPSMVELIVAVPVTHALTPTDMYQKIMLSFRAAGWHAESVLPSLSAIETFIFGAALDSPAPANAYEPVPDSSSVELRDSYDSYTQLLRRTGTQPRDIVFQIGLDALLTGLQLHWSGNGSNQEPR